MPILGLVAILVVVLLRYADPWLSILPLGVLVLLYLVFRDPRREVPSVALGIVSPVDGEVVEVDTTDRCVVQGEAYRVRIHINVFGTYTARSPIEGRIMDLHSKIEDMGLECPANAQWVETDEGDSVVLQFHEYRFGLAPRSFVKLGERVGQGDRCAVIRLARYAELYLPIDGKVVVEPGQVIKAGNDIVGTVPHR